MKKLMLVFLLLLVCCGIAAAEGPIAEFTGAESILPFAKLSAWNLSPQQAAKALGGTPENAGGKDKAIYASITLEGLGDRLPVTYLFRNNKLASVSVVLEEEPVYDPKQDLASTDAGLRLVQYMDSFRLPGAKTVKVRNGSFRLAFSGKTDVAYGYVRNGDHASLAMKFYPPADVKLNVFKSASGYQSRLVSDTEMQFYPAKPHLFEHTFTYGGRTFTYSWFLPALQMENAASEGKIPRMAVVFAYNGIHDPGKCLSLQFSVNGSVYRLKGITTQQLARTQYGEYSRNYVFWVGPDNRALFDAMKKGGKQIGVTLEGENQTLDFPMPNQSRQQLVNAYNLLEKAGGLNEIFMDYVYFMQSPASVF